MHASYWSMWANTYECMNIYSRDQLAFGQHIEPQSQTALAKKNDRIHIGPLNTLREASQIWHV